jgi:serine/threonine-protein kinase
MPAHADFKAGDMLPGTKYRIVRELGAGGMGVVYHVIKPPEIQGVLKLMSAELATHAEFQSRFIDEVRVLAQLEHPNIVRVNDYDKISDGTPFYVMELLHGRTLRDVVATVGAVAPRVAYEITRQLLEALHCAHTHTVQVVHRDIKPENIFLHAPKHGDPVVKLIDFGVVALSDRPHDGQFVGTWRYAAPEQIRGERATPATDLYAVGLVLYEMLAGAGPFDALETGSLLSQAHLNTVPQPVSRLAPWVPASIVELIASALAKDPRQRPRDAYAFAERLYELEWAEDGKHAEGARTSEGPLSRVLSSVSAGKASSKNLEAAKPADDRLGDVPLIGVPPVARHRGPTIQGVGNGPEATAPDDDELLAGLIERREHEPFAKKVRDSEVASTAGPRSGGAQVVIRPSGPDRVSIEQTPRSGVPHVGASGAYAGRGASAGRAGMGPNAATGAPTLDAPPSRPGAVASDTFASNASDARGVPKGGAARLAIPIAAGAIALACVVTGGVFALRRMGGAGATGAPSQPAAASATPSPPASQAAGGAPENAPSASATNEASEASEANTAASASAASAATDKAAEGAEPRGGRSHGGHKASSSHGATPALGGAGARGAATGATSTARAGAGGATRPSPTAPTPTATTKPTSTGAGYIKEF